MIELRPLDSLGVTTKGHLIARHHFCYGHYERAGRNGWGRLRVFNHTVLRPGAELPPQPLDNVEMLQWVRRGVLGHEGTIGGRCRTLAGEVLVTSTGAGIAQGAANRGSRSAEYYDIRIVSDVIGGEPSWKTIVFPARARPGRLVTLASGFSADSHAVPIRARAQVSSARLPTGARFTHKLREGNRGYLVAAAGSADINGVVLNQGDGAAIDGEPVIQIKALKAVELLLIETA